MKGAKQYVNVVQAFIDAVCPQGEGHDRAVAIIKERLDRNYSVSMLYAWRAGSRPLPEPVFRLMFRTVLRAQLEAVGGALPSGEAEAELARRLLPPERL